MKSETTEQHKKISSDDITCGIITLSDSRKSEKLDLSGQIISEEIESVRLGYCRQCDKINQGTCLACGCFVEIRAATKKGRCPYKKW